MMIYAGGQQPYQRVNVGTNVLQAKFTIAAWGHQFKMIHAATSAMCLY